MQIFLHDKYKYDISLINLTILLFIYRTAIPFFKYPFIVLYGIAIVYLVYSYRRTFVDKIKVFTKKFAIVLLLLLIIILAFLFSKKIYLSVFKEIINSIVLISLFLLLTTVITEKSRLVYFKSNIIQLILYFSIVVSFAILLEVLDIYSYSGVYSFYSISDRPPSGNTYVDYNFALLPVFFGMIVILTRLNKRVSFYKIVLLNLLLLIFALSIYFSASKRGIVVFLCILIFLLVIEIPFWKRKVYLFDILARNIRLFILLLISTGIFFYIFINYLTPLTKNRILNSIGANNITIAKKKISVSALRYGLMFDKGTTHESVYKKLWFQNIDLKNPESVWESLSHNIIKPITGQNIEIIPDYLNEKGYQLDYTSFTDYYEGYARSATIIFQKEVDEDNVFCSSIYCFVSKDFDGDVVSLSSGGTSYGNTLSDYNIKNKGIWQKLVVYGKCFNGEANIELIFSKNNITNFKDLKGYIIFSHPRFEANEFVLDPRDPDTGWGTNYHKTVFPLIGTNVEIVPLDAKGYLLDSSTNVSMPWGGNCYSLTRPINNIDVEEGDTVVASVFCFVSDTYNGSYVLSELVNAQGLTLKSSEYQLYYKNRWQKLEIKTAVKKCNVSFKLWFSQQGVRDFRTLNGHVIWAYPRLNVIKNNINSKPKNNGEYGEIGGLQKSSATKIFPDHRVEDKIRTVSMKASDQTELTLFDSHIVNTTSVFVNPFKHLGVLRSKYTDKDPVRNFISGLVSEDTTYYGFKSNLVVDTLSNELIDRTLRWGFAAKIFLKEYSLPEKIFGGGFSFLNWYGFIFQKDKKIIDYPHNPFLHVLLYSGLFGLLIYVIFILKVFKFYFKFFHEFTILSICFFITFFFTFFSGGTSFDPPMMGFFVMLPFFIYSIYEKNKPELFDDRIS
jgi:hypothetical protein